MLSYTLSLFYSNYCVNKAIIRITDVLRIGLKGVEVVDLPHFDVQLKIPL